MAQRFYTSVSINKTIYEQAKKFAELQRPPWNFSALVEIALEDFLIAQEQLVKKKNETIKTSANVELIQAA